MDRRTFNKLAGLTALAAMTENMELSAAQAAAITGDVVLEDKDLLVAFDPASGALTRLEHKPTKWVIERRPALGVSFRMHAPLPTQRTNFIWGQKQQAKSVKKITDNQVQIQWSNLESQHGGVLPITFTATVTLKGGALTFDGVLGQPVFPSRRVHRLSLLWRPESAYARHAHGGRAHVCRRALR